MGRERGGRERELCAGELNEGKETRGGGHDIGRGRAPGVRGPSPGRARPDRVGPHCGTTTHDEHNHRSESKRETKSKTRRSNTRN
jgi:hypothetical protein